MPEENELSNVLLQMMEAVAPVISTAEGIRKRLSEDLGWDDMVAQQVAAAWLVKHLVG